MHNKLAHSCVAAQIYIPRLHAQPLPPALTYEHPPVATLAHDHPLACTCLCFCLRALTLARAHGARVAAWVSERHARTCPPLTCAMQGLEYTDLMKLKRVPRKNTGALPSILTTPPSATMGGAGEGWGRRAVLCCAVLCCFCRRSLWGAVLQSVWAALRQKA